MAEARHQILYTGRLYQVLPIGNPILEVELTDSGHETTMKFFITGAISEAFTR